MTGGKDGGWPEDFDFDGIKIEEWIPLPLNILLPKDVGEVVRHHTLPNPSHETDTFVTEADQARIIVCYQERSF